MLEKKYNLQFFGEPSNDPAPGNGDKGGDDHKEPDKKTFTQEEIDKIVKERLKRERERFADYDDLKKLADEGKKLKEAQMSELEKLKAQIAETEKQKKEIEREATELKQRQVKAKLLSAEGLSLELIDRVKGENEEEIKTDIEEIKKLFKVKDIGGGGAPSKGNPPKPEDIEAQYAKALKDGDIGLAMSLNSQLFEAKKKKG